MDSVKTLFITINNLLILTLADMVAYYRGKWETHEHLKQHYYKIMFRLLQNKIFHYLATQTLFLLIAYNWSILYK